MFSNFYASNISAEIQTLETGRKGQRIKVWVRSVKFHKGQNSQFNLTNHRLATQWIVERWCAVERWRAVRKNPTPVIGQIKVVGKMHGRL